VSIRTILLRHIKTKCNSFEKQYGSKQTILVYTYLHNTECPFFAALCTAALAHRKPGLSETSRETAAVASDGKRNNLHAQLALLSFVFDFRLLGIKRRGVYLIRTDASGKPGSTNVGRGMLI